MSILEEIIAYKTIEIESLKEQRPLPEMKKVTKNIKVKKNNFVDALKSKISTKQIAIIAEIKKASPSKGVIRKDFNHIEIAKAYKDGGATCLSVLTDKKYFQGDLKYIKEIKSVVDLPVLRKDFIIDPYQIYESISSGADCLLLIIAALEKDMLKRLYELSCESEINCLIEVHDEREIERALELNCQLIGINNRDLKTFEVNLNTTKSLVKKYKRDLKNKIIVSESGIFTSEDIKSLIECGVYSFLVGESLIREQDIKKATSALMRI